MKKQSFTMVVMVLLTLFVVSTARAQSANQQFKAKIPFAFNVGAQTLPAGDYEVTIVNPASDQRILKITGAGETGNAMLQTHAVKGKSNLSAKLVFHRYGDHYFLAQVWTGADDMGLEAARSVAEKAFQVEYDASQRRTESVGLTRGQ